MSCLFDIQLGTGYIHLHPKLPIKCSFCAHPVIFLKGGLFDTFCSTSLLSPDGRVRQCFIVLYIPLTSAAAQVLYRSPSLSDLAGDSLSLSLMNGSDRTQEKHISNKHGTFLLAKESSLSFSNHFTPIYVQLPYLSKFGPQQLLWHLLWSHKESCYLLVLEIGKLRQMSCYHSELNLIASLLFLGQNQFCFIYFLDIWSHFTKFCKSSQAKDLRPSGKESEWKKGICRTTTQNREVMTPDNFLKDSDKSYLRSKHPSHWQSEGENLEKGAEPGHHHIFLPS